MISEYRMDHDYKRFIVLVTVPFLLCVSLVRIDRLSRCYTHLNHSTSFSACRSLRTSPLCTLACLDLLSVSNTVSSLGPVAQYHENSKYYSAVPPEPNPEVDGRLPHVTVELPVYKESLEETM